MAETAADVLIETIHDGGVDTIFGLPGDGIHGITGALRIRPDRIRSMLAKSLLRGEANGKKIALRVRAHTFRELV